MGHSPHSIGRQPSCSYLQRIFRHSREKPVDRDNLGEDGIEGAVGKGDKTRPGGGHGALGRSPARRARTSAVARRAGRGREWRRHQRTGNFCVYGSVPRRYAAQGATRRALRAHTHAPIRPLLKRSGALRAPQTYNEPFLPSEYIQQRKQILGATTLELLPPVCASTSRPIHPVDPLLLVVRKIFASRNFCGQRVPRRRNNRVPCETCPSEISFVGGPVGPCSSPLSQ